MAATWRGYLSHIIPPLLERDKKFSFFAFSIVDVRATPDLRLATIIICDSQKECPKLLSYLNKLAPQIQHKLAPFITAKYVPSIRFVFDLHSKHDQKMRELMSAIQKDLDNNVKDPE